GPAGESCKCWMALIFCHLEGTSRRIDSFPQWPLPGHQDREIEIGPPSPEVLQAAMLDQIAGHLCESIAFIVLAEAGASDETHGRVAKWRGIAVAALQTEIDRSADNKRV